MNILCIMHADFETPGVISAWAQENHHHFVLCKPYLNEALPANDSFESLIVMGGPQSAIEVANYPYLLSEIELIKNAIAHNKKILGICLGAQLIGEAFGAKTMRSPEKEVGVYSITLTAMGMQDPLLKDFPQTFSVVHWHNDMPGLTTESVVLATSIGCSRQIIRYREKIYGVQCHFEIEKEGIAAMVKAAPDDLKPSLFTQTQEDLLLQDYSAINQMMRQILDQFQKC